MLDRANFKSGNPKRILTEVLSSMVRQLRGREIFAGGGFSRLWWETAWFRTLEAAHPGVGAPYMARAAAGLYTYGAKLDPIRCIQLINICRCCNNAACVRAQFTMNLARRKMHWPKHGGFLCPSAWIRPNQPLFIQPFTSSPAKRLAARPLSGRGPALAGTQGCKSCSGGGPTEQAALETVRCRAGFPVSAGVPLLVTGGLAKLSTLTLGGFLTPGFCIWLWRWAGGW